MAVKHKLLPQPRSEALKEVVTVSSATSIHFLYLLKMLSLTFRRCIPFSAMMQGRSNLVFPSRPQPVLLLTQWTHLLSLALWPIRFSSTQRAHSESRNTISDSTRSTEPDD